MIRQINSGGWRFLDVDLSKTTKFHVLHFRQITLHRLHTNGVDYVTIVRYVCWEGMRLYVEGVDRQRMENGKWDVVHHEGRCQEVSILSLEKKRM